MALRRFTVTFLASLAAAQPTLEEMREYAAANPHEAGARSNYGAALKASGDLPAAIAEFEAALSLDPTYARAYNNYGNAKQALGEYHDAIRLHTTAIELMPTLVTAYNNLGNALREVGQPVQAVAVLEKAVVLSPTYTAAYTNLGAAAQASGAPDHAVIWHSFAQRLAPGDPTVSNNLGAALEANGQVAEAGAAFERGLAVAPTSTTLRINLGNTMRKRGRLEEAIQSYTAALEADPEGVDAPLAYNNLAAVFQSAGESQRALQAYEAAIALRPADATLAQTNLDKLPISRAYLSAAAYESRVLASRAARAALALGAARRAKKDWLGRSTGKGARAGGVGAPDAVLLHRAMRYLRQIETEQVEESTRLWGVRASEMSHTLTDGTVAEETTLGAFAWGGVWGHTLAAVFTNAESRTALYAAAARHAKRSSGRAPDGAIVPDAERAVVVLGSSIGFEAYLAALTFGVPTVGVELLPGLVELSEDVRSSLQVPLSVVKFECADALTFRLPTAAALVYVDDTAWDVPVIERLATRLKRELRSGAVVVHNTKHGYEVEGGFRRVAVVEVGTSWNPKHLVYVEQVL